ncbi:MAG: MFS transporter [Rhodobacteraceae bacterium]|nr:MFS transporter [Paracoccaceae bacterium]
MRWRILALLFFARVGLGFQFQTMTSVGDNVAAAFGLDYAEIGVLIGLFMLPGLFLALPAGFAGRYASDRFWAGLGLAALALGGLISGLAPEPAFIGLGRLVSGAGFLFSTLYFTKMIADWFDGREIATAMSILVMSWPFGIAMGQVGHAWLSEVYGWRLPFFVATIYCGLAALGVAAFYRAPREHAGAGQGRSWNLLPIEWGLVICAGAAWGLFNAGYVAYLSFGPKMLEAQGIEPVAAASLISVGSWLMILSGAACGQIADRFGRRDTIMVICMGAAVGALALLGVPGGGLWASLLFGLLGMAPAGVIMALAGQAVAPERRAFGMGIFFTLYYAIMAASPPVAGAIFDATGTANGSIVFGMTLFASVVPVVFAFRLIGARGQKSRAPTATSN